MSGSGGIRQRLRRAFKGARKTYRDLGRFQRLRVAIVALLLMDVAATGMFILSVSRPPGDLSVAYRAEFPTKLVIVTNRSTTLTDAQVTLDDVYRYMVPRLEVGPVGIDLRDFRDADGYPPDASYLPRRAVIRTPQSSYEMSVGIENPSP